MSKPPSVETQLRTTKSELSKLRKENAELKTERNRYRASMEIASAECKRWQE